MRRKPIVLAGQAPRSDAATPKSMSKRKADVLKQEELFAGAESSAAVPPGEDALVAVKLSELCRRIGTDYDEARYALARGLLPPGITARPGRGNHRLFDADQAFTLAVLLKLKAAGISTEVAQQIAKCGRSIQFMARNLGYNPSFVPFNGRLKTDARWDLEVGDARYFRIVTDAVPSAPLEKTPWCDMRTRREDPTVHPVVVFQIDIAHLARLLSGPSF
jgi:hypothetical protein